MATPRATRRPARTPKIIAKAPQVRCHVEMTSAFHIAISDDGRFVAGGGGVAVDAMDAVYGFDPSVRLWDASSRTFLAPLETPHVNQTRSSRISLSFLPGGHSLLTAGDDGLVIEWDVATQTELRRFGREGAITCMGVSADGEILVTGGSFEDGRLRMWSVREGRLSSTLEGSYDWGASAVAIDAARERVISAGGGDGNSGVRVHDLSSGEELRRIGRAAGGVHALSISPDGAWVVTGGRSTIGRIWSIDTGKRRVALDGKRGSYGVAFHPDDQRVLSTCEGALCIWDAETGALLHSVDGKGAAPLALSRDGRHAVTAGPRGLLYWDL